MPDFPPLRGDGQRTQTTDVVAATSLGTQAPGSASVNTKGVWTTLLAATTFDAIGILVHLNHNTAAILDALVDIGIGAAAAEYAVVSNLLVTGQQRSGFSVYIPVAIPAGSRISARSQATTASVQMLVAVTMVSGGLTGLGMGICTTYGTNTADSGAVSVDPGGTANTKGAWSEIVASTTRPMSQGIVMIGNQAQATRTSTYWLVDIGIGAAGVEQVLLSNLTLCVNATGDEMLPHLYGPIPMHLPVGTRIVARAQSALNTATVRLFDVALYGIT